MGHEAPDSDKIYRKWATQTLKQGFLGEHNQKLWGHVTEEEGRENTLVFA